MTSWKDWNSSDILWGIIIPCIVGFLIIICARVRVDPSYALNAILVDGFGEAILTVAIPMFVGLVWDKWAGGAAGFITGSIYALFVNNTLSAAGAFTASSMVVCAMLTGYIAGSLNGDSLSFRRMFIAGIVGGIIGGLFLLWTQLISPFGMVTDLPTKIFLILLPRIIYGFIIPIFANLFVLYGQSPKQMG
jgi:hypothetical protein